MMNRMFTPSRCFFTFAALLFLSLFVVGKDCGYFGDCIQQISREALWLYSNDWTGIFTSDFPGTGYHLPFMGLTTAVLWHLFGQSVVVSHAYALVWAVVFVRSLWVAVSSFVSGWRAFVLGVCVLSLPTVLSQFFIASPDFIMLASLVLALAGLVRGRLVLFAIGLFFLGLHNMRGAISCACLVGSAVFVFWRLRRPVMPLLLASAPCFVTLAGYYVVRLVSVGWFLSDSSYAEHYVRPDSLAQFFHGVASLGLRVLENGQFVFWCVAIVVVWRWLRDGKALSTEQQVLVLFALSQVAVFCLFLVSTSMPFSNRYFLPLQVAVMLLVLPDIFAALRARLVFAAILLANLTGHLWIYPDRMAQCWDGTLAHVGFYDLRDVVLRRVGETEGVRPDGTNVSTGFCFYFPEREYRPSREPVFDVATSRPDVSPDFYLYSNICNESKDFIDELHDASRWTPIFTEKRGFVFATLYKRIEE